MASILLTRNAQSRWRVTVICAMLPLALLNDRTVSGCGCSGHFETVCRCNCSGASCCGKHSGTACPCCNTHGTAKINENKGSTDSSKIALYEHHCKGAVQHEAIPATVITSANSADEIALSALVLDAVDRPVRSARSIGNLVPGHFSPPPVDRVVTLRRLVI